MNKQTEKMLNEICSALERGEAIEVRPVPNEPQAFSINLFEVLQSLVKNWKKIILITLLFALLGTIGAKIYYSSKSPLPHLDLYTGTEINSQDADSYQKIFVDADEYNKEINKYIDALDCSVHANNYDGKEKDAVYLGKLREKINATYVNTFGLGSSLNSLYSPVRDKDVEKTLVSLEVIQKDIANRIVCLQGKLSYLSGITSAGGDFEGTATDAAIARGIEDAGQMAVYKQEYEKNTKIINELSDDINNPVRIQQVKRIDNLIQEGFSANKRFSTELNQFAAGYSKRQNMNITVSYEPDFNNPKNINYSVIAEKTKQSPKAIILLSAFLGFILGCVWVLCNYYKAKPQQLEQQERTLDI